MANYIEIQRLVRYFQWRVIVNIPSSWVQLIVHNNVIENSVNAKIIANEDIFIKIMLTIA